MLYGPIVVYYVFKNINNLSYTGLKGASVHRAFAWYARLPVQPCIQMNTLLGSSYMDNIY